jgi:hypothetical protein
MPIGVQYRQNILGSEESYSGLTTSLWADCPLDSILNGAIQGVVVEPDLQNYDSTATTVQNNCGLPTFEGDCTVGGVATVGGGVALFCTTDNEEASIQFCGDASAPFVIPADSADGKKLWFECEVKRGTTVTLDGGFFVGLASEGAAVADFIADGGADFSDVDLLGFWNNEIDFTVDIITQKTTAAFDTILAEAETLAADVYTRLGFIYDPNGPAKKKIKFYVNGKELTTYVGENSGDQTVYLGDTTNFPGGEEMAPVIALKAGNTGTDLTITLRKLRCVQLL